ncbi:MAG: CopG family transcriptional regulator [Crenarchaeota archaeon]|nr:CopG family transcriptional regulator [Thermoproteota archaeon]
MPGEDMVEIKIRLPEKLYREAKAKAEEAGFNTIDEFIVFVLEQLLGEEEPAELSEEDEEKVKERLRALGYID